MAERTRFNQIIPQFVVPDVVRTAEYYRDKLGFTILDYFLDTPVYAMVKRDDVEVHFGKADGDATHQNEAIRKGVGNDVYIIVADIDSVADELSKAGVEIMEGPVKRVYGSIEVIVRDCNGFKIAFSN